jgi:hypothetical protein
MNDLHRLRVPGSARIEDRLIASLNPTRCLHPEDVTETRNDHLGIVIANEIIERYISEQSDGFEVFLTIAETRVCNAGIARDGNEAYVVLTTGLIKFLYEFCRTLCATERLSAFLRGDFEARQPRAIINPWERRDFIRSMSTEGEEREVSSREWFTMGMPDDVKSSIREYFRRDMPFQPTPPNDLDALTNALFALCICFIVYHELGHLALRHAEVRNVSTDSMLFMAEVGEEDCHESRVAEMEADRYALHRTIVESIESPISGLHINANQIEVCIARVILAEYMVLTFLLSIKFDDATFIEDEQGTHPHALLRHVVLTYQLRSVLESINNNGGSAPTINIDALQSLLVEADAALCAVEWSFCEYDTMRLPSAQYDLARARGGAELEAATITSRKFSERRSKLGSART